MCVRVCACVLTLWLLYRSDFSFFFSLVCTTILCKQQYQRHFYQLKTTSTTVYGPDGKRQNTRAVRWKERFTLQRQDLLEKLLRHNSTLSGSGGGGNPLALVSGLGGGGMLGSSHNNNNNALSLLRPTKTTKKIPIPIEKHPNYNFIGLIIGPRGKTQKELEAKTGCKIAIRGKGSVKEGARGRRDGASDIGDYEPLHVVVSGDDPRAVQAASTMIADMLVVIDDERNVHKQQQLRELALLNGTLKDDETGATVYCPVCAEKGHRAFECPKRFATAGRGNNSSGNTNNGPTLLVQCAICGDTSHPTRDCKQQKGGLFQPPSAAPPVDSQQVDSDYQSFMAELESGPRDGGRGATSSTAIVSSTSSTNTMPVTSTSAPVDEKSMAVTLPVPGGEAMLPPPPPPPPPILPPVPLLPPPPQAPSQSLSSGYPYSNGNPPHQQSQQQQQQHHQMYPLPHHQQQQHSYSGHSQQQQQHSYYQQQQQHQPYSQNAFPNPPTDYPGHAASGPGFSHGPDNGGNNTNNNQQQQQQQVIVPGEETATWDPNAYYGSGNAATGAGGFNWWEQ